MFLPKALATSYKATINEKPRECGHISKFLFTKWLSLHTNQIRCLSQYIYGRYIKHTFFCIIGLGDIKMPLIQLKNFTQNFSRQHLFILSCFMLALGCLHIQHCDAYKVPMNWNECVMCSMYECGASYEWNLYKKSEAGKRTIPICSHSVNGGS